MIDMLSDASGISTVERGVCRVYEMSIGEDGEWKLWREGEPFPQRFSATISDDGETIVGRWEKAPDGRTWETDFYLTYRKVSQAASPRTYSNASTTDALFTRRRRG